MSKSAIDGLEPKLLWERFYEITRVPRPSKKEEKIRSYLRQFLKDLKVKFEEDEIGNIVARIPASKGYEKSSTVVLQAHVDMVCEKNKSKKHDFENDPIEIIRENEWIKANGTTLGADNGIGVASALALINDINAVRGPLEILLTVDEETGLTGATNVKGDFIKGRTLLNLDSEEDGVFYIGCAGGIDTIGEFSLQTETAPQNFQAYNLLVTGLKGGHSGMEINQGRGNAIKILARALKNLTELSQKNGSPRFYISTLDGGKLRNAIPREAETTILIESKDEDNVKFFLDNFRSQVFEELKKTDNKLSFILEKSNQQVKEVIKPDILHKIIDTLVALPSGVISMSPDIHDLVETSTNLATLFTKDKKVVIGTSQRSSVESERIYIAQNVKAIFDLAGAKVRANDGYPGWKPDLESNILKISKKVYKGMFGIEPEVKAIHAGLETGILGAKNPGLDMVSFGPTIKGAHSPEERVNIKSTQKFYNLLKGILKEVAVSSKK